MARPFFLCPPGRCNMIGAICLALSTQVLQTYFLLSRTYFFLPPRYFLLFAQKKFVTNFVTRITNFVTCVRNFVTHVRNFVTKTFLWDRKKFVGETKILLGASKKYPAHSRISLRGASSLLQLRCADIHTILIYIYKTRDAPHGTPLAFLWYFLRFRSDLLLSAQIIQLFLPTLYLKSNLK